MEFVTYFKAALLGIIEGLTEFLPISSTGHLILAMDLLSFEGPPVFEIAIQLGAILAICWIYRQKFFHVAVNLRKEYSARHFVLTVFIALMPALVLGAIFHDFIKQVLFSPIVVSVALIIGGIAIILIERLPLKPVVFSTDGLSPKKAFAIGLCQAVSMIPGVSRAGATIMGGLLLKLDRKTATEFSFFLAVPTMAAATAYDIYKNFHALEADTHGLVLLTIGFVTAFITAVAVVRWLLSYIQTHNFTWFGVYRIGLGALMLLFLLGNF